MTNGASPHGLKRTKKAAGKKAQARKPKASPKRKRWVPAGLAAAKE